MKDKSYTYRVRIIARDGVPWERQVLNYTLHVNFNLDNGSFFHRVKKFESIHVAFRARAHGKIVLRKISTDTFYASP